MSKLRLILLRRSKHAKEGTLIFLKINLFNGKKRLFFKFAIKAKHIVI